MAVSEIALYQALEDLARRRWATAPGAAVDFRVDRVGLVLTDNDFVLPARPEEGYSSAYAAETFARLVNRVPLDLCDGRSVLLTDAGIDESYFYRVLSPSVPAFPPTADLVARQAELESFSRIKSDALRLWEKATLTSVTGLPIEHRATLATPQAWYDPSRADVWSHHEFVLPPDTDSGEGSSLQWRLKIDDTTMAHLLGADHGMDAADVATALPLLVAAARSEEVEPGPGTSDDVGQLDRHTEMHDDVLIGSDALPVDERLATQRFLSAQASTFAARVDGDLTVAFDYLLVGIDRLWLLRPFLDQPHWYVPGQPSGFATLPRGALGLLPLAMLVIRNLSITGAWDDTDVAASAVASDFGPFRTHGAIEGATLTASALQVVGWLYEPLGGLPPDNAPDSATTDSTPPPAEREYDVRPGDSLWHIANAFYGDGRRWRVIAERNHLADPDHLTVGQHLVIP